MSAFWGIVDWPAAVSFVSVVDGPQGLTYVTASRPLSPRDGVLDVRSNATR